MNDITNNPTLSKIRAIIAGTEFDGHTFVAGGFVRDAVMSRDSNDIDLTVDLPEGGVRLAALLRDEAGATDVHTFERFGTAQIVLDGVDVELVAARSETYSGGSRRPVVAFADLRADVLRRDFTVNTLVMNLTTGEILDVSGRGFNDIAAKVIDVTTDPDTVFNDDPLRMLRAVRFASQLGFTVSARTLDGIREHAESLTRISRERVRDEMVKLLAGPNFAEALRMMVATGLSRFVLPELAQMAAVDGGKFHTKNPFEHTLDVVGRVPASDTRLRFAALLHDSGKPAAFSVGDDGAHFYGHAEESAKVAERVMADLKFSTDDTREVVEFVANHMRLLTAEPPSPKLVRRLVRDLGGRERFERFLLLVAADVKLNPAMPRPFDTVAEVKRVLTEDDEKRVPVKLPVSGFDVMAVFGLTPGPEVGRLLSVAADRFFENPEATKDELLSVMGAAR